MASTDFDVVLKKEAKTPLQVFKDQSLLRRKFGDEAVALYEAIDSGKTAAKLMEELGLSEDKFIEILEYMNNNAMVSIESPEIGSGALRERGGEAPSDDEGAAPQEPQEEAAPVEEAPAEPEEEAPKIVQFGKSKKQTDESLLSPLEKIIFDSYGDIGVRVYNLIDGEKTAEEILKETGISESKLVEILEFMDEKGIIKLEKPGSPGGEPGGDGGDGGGEDRDETESKEEPQPNEDEKGDSEKSREPRFSPMSEDLPEGKPFIPEKAPEKPKDEKPPEHVEPPGEDIVMVDVPAMNKISFVQKASMMADLSTKFDRRAGELMKLIDGNRDFIALGLESQMALFEIDAVMAHFGKKGLISFRQLDRNEIKKRYGEDGFTVYKRYGREGLLLYEMIGKEASLKDIIVKSRVDPERAIDIFMFIHKVLGLDVPIDRDLIYRQIGLKK